MEILLVAYPVVFFLALYIVAAARYEFDEDPLDFDEGGELGVYMRAERFRIHNLQFNTFDKSGLWNVEKDFDHKARWEWQKRQIELDRRCPLLGRR